MKTKISLMMLLLAAWLLVGCEPINEPTTEEGGTTTVDDSNIASVNKVTNYYGTIYEVILKDGNRMYFGIKNDSEVRMGNWGYFYDGSGYEYEKYAAYEYKGHLVIPEKITLEGKEYTVTELYGMSVGSFNKYDQEYKNPNTTLLSVTIPKTIKKMTDYCFQACTSLKSVTFEKGSPIKELSVQFIGCSSLEDVVLPDNLSSIGRDAWSATFAFCTSLKTITLPKSVTTIKDEAFYGCTALENINLENIKVVGEGHVHWMEEVGAFAGCTSLKTINLENAVKIHQNAFYKCTSLETVKLDNLEVLETCAFDGCTSLKSIVANKLDTIEAHAFNDCINLKKVELSKAIKIMDNAFHGCISLEDVKLDNLEVLGVNAFDSCTSLKQIELPSIKYLGISVEEDDDWWLDGDAFKNCHSLETVVLGSSLLSTNEGDLFNGCNNLKDVYCYAVNPPMDTDGEEGLFFPRKFVGDFVLHVPASSIEAYKETTWGDVYRVREDDGFIYQDDVVRTIVAIEE